jgi:branched-chain amino acid aminotransferase
MPEITAFFNGNWILTSELRIPVDDLGFLLGATVTERLRTFHGEIFRLESHLERLRHSLELVGLDSAKITEEVARALPEFLQRNRGIIDADDDWSLVVFATPGIARENRPTICVHGFPLPFSNWAAQYDAGVSVVISSIRQLPPDCLPPQLKCRSRMHFYLADREAALEQAGSRAILLDENGHIAEATTANVLVYRKGEGLISPPPEHILAGVSLGVLHELAAKLEIPFIYRRLTPDEFCSADEALLTSTSVCILPIVECTGMPIGDRRPGPIYQRLLEAWSNLVGLKIPNQAQRFATARM